MNERSMNTEGRASDEMTDEQLEVFQDQVTKKYGISVLGHPDRLRWFFGDLDRASRARDRSAEHQDAQRLGPKGAEPGAACGTRPEKSEREAPSVQVVEPSEGVEALAWWPGRGWRRTYWLNRPDGRAWVVEERSWVEGSAWDSGARPTAWLPMLGDPTSAPPAADRRRHLTAEDFELLKPKNREEAIAFLKRVGIMTEDGGLSPRFYSPEEIAAQASALPAAQQPAEPVAWVRFCSDGCYEGPIMDCAMEEVRKKSGAWTPLYASPTAQPGASHE